MFLLQVFNVSYAYSFSNLSSESGEKRKNAVLFSKENRDKRRLEKKIEKEAIRQQKQAEKKERLEARERAVSREIISKDDSLQETRILDEVDSNQNIPSIQLNAFEGAVQLFEDIPESYREYVNLTLPQQNLITIKDKVAVKGQNLMLTDTFVNGVPVRVRSDGGFYQEIDLKKEGKQSVLISFVRPDLSFFSIKRNIVHLYTPGDIDNYNFNRKRFIYFYNADLIFNPDYDRLLGGSFTRADMAYFISRLLKDDYKAKYKARFNDVSKESWEYPFVGFVAKKKIMMEFPDGSFKPQETVTKLEFIVTLVRALDLKFVETNQPLPFNDIDSSHWSAKYIRTALANKIISSSSQFSPNKLLTLGSFIEMTDSIPGVSEALAHIINFEEGFELSEDQALIDLEPVIAFVEKRKSEMELLRNIEFNSPQSGAVVFEDSVTINGQIFPADVFIFNEQTIQPNLIGEFNFNQTVLNGRNEFLVEALDATSNYVIYRLNSYLDLEEHWVKTVAAKLKYIGLLPEEDYFYPNQIVTKSLFAHYLSQGYDLELKDDTDSFSIADVETNNNYYQDILAVIQNQIMSLNENGEFDPDQELQRAAVITAVVRSLELLQPDIFNETTETVDFPFWDVSSQHWARPYIQKALNLGIISSSSQFRPKDTMSKAELISLLSKTPVLEEKLNFVFYTN